MVAAYDDNLMVLPIPLLPDAGSGAVGSAGSDQFSISRFERGISLQLFRCGATMLLAVGAIIGVCFVGVGSLVGLGYLGWVHSRRLRERSMSY